MRLHVRLAAACTGWLLAILAATCPARAADGYTMPPPDPAALSPAAKQMVAELTRIVADRDLAALLRHTDPDARQTGNSEKLPLREALQQDFDHSATMWKDLEDILRLGGLEQVNDLDGERTLTWCAPYMSCQPHSTEGEPHNEEIDEFQTVVVTGTGVALRAAPHADAPVLARVDYAVLTNSKKDTRNRNDCQGAWRCVTWHGRPAYVSETWVHETLGWTVQIRLLQDGSWQIKQFAAGC